MARALPDRPALIKIYPGAGAQSYTFTDTASRAATPARSGHKSPGGQSAGLGCRPVANQLGGIGRRHRPLHAYVGVAEINLTNSPNFSGRIRGSVVSGGPRTSQDDFLSR